MKGLDEDWMSYNMYVVCCVHYVPMTIHANLRFKLFDFYYSLEEEKERVKAVSAHKISRRAVTSWLPSIIIIVVSILINLKTAEY